MVRARLGIGTSPTPDEWTTIRGWYADRGWTEHPPAYVPRPVPPVRPAPPPPPPDPPVDPGEVRALLARCCPVPPDVPDWRLVSPARGLAAWIPDGCDLPRWARYGGRSWLQTGHRVLIPMYDVEGRIAGIRARAADRARAHPKALPPLGHSIGPLCMASPTARAWLRGTETPTAIAVVEGEPAWMLWSAAAPPGTAVLGIISGSWSEAWRDAIAAAGCPVVVVTDHDDKNKQGDKYAATWMGGVPRSIRWPHEKDDVG
jgi:hypothetical protein